MSIVELETLQECYVSPDVTVIKTELEDWWEKCLKKEYFTDVGPGARESYSAETLVQTVLVSLVVCGLRGGWMVH